MGVGYTAGLARALSRLVLVSCALTAFAREFEITQIADERRINREPVISETGLIAWSMMINPQPGDPAADIVAYYGGQRKILTEGKADPFAANHSPAVQSNTVMWVAAYNVMLETGENWILADVPEDQEDQATEPVATNGEAEASAPAPEAGANSNTVIKVGGELEISRWSVGDAEVQRITADRNDDIHVAFWGRLAAWQKARGWPYGWEIMAWADGQQMQLTTNYYYDMAPKVYDQRIVWYGWDGVDFEIFQYDHADGSIRQITNNRYDDVSPAIWGSNIVWEAYPGVDADIFFWDGSRIRKISDNIEDDLNPRIWEDNAVWQGFDGDDFEIYLFDGEKTIKMTSNTYDDLNPDIRDGLICWMGYYGNWDSEIFVWDGRETARLTDNDYDDLDPHTSEGRLVWQAEPPDQSLIYQAVPKP